MERARYTFLDFARDVLEVAPNPLTFMEIWAAGQKQGFVSRLAINGKTPWQTLGARLYVDIRDNCATPFMKVGKNPSRFWLLSRKDQLTEEDLTKATRVTPEIAELKPSFHERELHPLLAYFAFTNAGFNRGRQVYTKTIFHERSKHATLSEWVHPDMVGFYVPIDDWEGTVLELNKATDKTALRFYSFEVKKQLDRSNYREYFFQAVSNSSWAHEGYLVACGVQQEDVSPELARLSASFGIGVILLDLSDLDSSRVLYPARVRDYLDWETINKLCEQNDDFRSFVDDVQRDYAGKKIHASEYDSILKDPDSHIRRLLGPQRGG